MSHRHHKAWLVAAGCLFTIVQAQVAPDAGRILRDSDRARREIPPVTAPSAGVPAAPAAPSAARPSADASKDVRILVNRILIPAGYAVTQDEVDAALQGRLGRRLNFSEIFDCLDIVADLLKKRGYPFARVFLPEQRINSADIQVRVYTGVLEGVEAVSRSKNPRVSPEDVAARVSSAIPRGKSFYAPAAERGLLLAADLVGSPVNGQLTPGSQPNTTRLIVSYDDAPATSWQVGADNYGNKFAGRTRVSGDGRVLSSMISGDAISFGLALSSDLTNWHVGYQAPVGPSGWTAGLSYSDIHYALSGAFAGFEGDARELRLSSTYPLVRTRSSSLYLDVAFASRDLSTVNGPFTLPRKVNSGSIGVRTERYDDLGGGGVTTADATVVVGSASADNAIDPANIRGAADGYSKVLLNLSRLQRITDGTSLTASARVQLTGDNLDTSEQGSLGGPFGLRAYANEEATGDQYAILSVELQHQLGAGWSLKEFVDHGNVTITKDLYAGFSGRQNYSLSDAGLGIEWAGSFLGSTTVFSVTAATALGDNPGLGASGLDSEGSTSDTRVWISLTSRF